MKRHAFLAGLLSVLCACSIQATTALAQGSIAPPTVPPSPRISAYLPVVDRPGIAEEHKRIADEVIRMLPARCRTQIKRFYVEYGGALASRGYASKSSVVMKGTIPAREFRAVLIHEVLGHVLDLGCITGNPGSVASAFRDGDEVMRKDDPSVAFYEISWVRSNVRRAGSKPADFASGYALHDAFEDAAEAMALYVLHPDVFRARAEANRAMARKLAWIETHAFPLAADGSRSALSRSLYRWDGREVAWDATKLPYVWHTEELVATR